jgi:hypothetical protein
MNILAWALFLSLTFGLSWAGPAFAQEDRHVVLVTIDGVRWQEVFRGADDTLTTSEDSRARFIDVQDKRAALMPFIAATEAEGAVIGNRDEGSCARVANDYWFSYPGYAEMMLGRPHPKIGANAKAANRETTVLEWLNGQPGFADRVRAVAEWDVVPYILDTARTGLPVWHPEPGVRDRDGPVATKGFEELAGRPRVLWIALGDTDNLAHAGDYHGYLAAAHAADAFLSKLWATIESDPVLAGRTTLLITTDHGRGASEGRKWRGHGSGRYRFGRIPFVLRREGSDAVWFAARGPEIATTREAAGDCTTTGQTAATLLRAIGMDYVLFDKRAAGPLPIFE